MDKNNIKIAKERLSKVKNEIFYIHSDFRYLVKYARENDFTDIDFILYDLGLSSPHLDNAENGFSFKKDGPLDMRFDKMQELTAQKIVNEYSEEEIAKIIKEYGEIRIARKLASRICEIRKRKKIRTTAELAEIIGSLKIMPQVFQALRIAVNDELRSLTVSLNDAVQLLKPGGRIAVISYHSLEDRIVKNVMNYYSKSCICPKEKIICDCEERRILKILNRKPIRPGEEEIELNPRSRSAKLRVAEKIK
jgi:16S rRNA (cytosine1402-N4)-methyltransferase